MIELDYGMLPDNSGIRTMPEIAIWASVLMQAIIDYQAAWGGSKYKDRWQKGHQELDCDDARRWFSSTSSNRGSFVWICDHLGMDYRTVRKRILAGPIGKLSYTQQADDVRKRERKRVQNAEHRARKKAEKLAMMGAMA